MIGSWKEKIGGAYELVRCEAESRKVEEGQGTAEYAVLIGLILTVAVTAVVVLADNIGETVDWANGSMDKIQTFTHTSTNGGSPTVAGSGSVEGSGH